MSGSEISVLPVLSHRILTVTLRLGTLWDLNCEEAEELRVESWQADSPAHSPHHSGLWVFRG